MSEAQGILEILIRILNSARCKDWRRDGIAFHVLAAMEMAMPISTAWPRDATTSCGPTAPAEAVRR